MSSSAVMTPAETIFTFKQGIEESFKEAWLRINKSYNEIEPPITLSLLLKSFYFGLMLHYRYALDTLGGGDFLQCDGDQAFNAIKKLIVINNSPTSLDSSLARIYARLSTLETHTACLKENYNHLNEVFEHVSINSEPTNWLPTIKTEISGETFYARYDIMTEFCLMPKDIYESLNLWELSEGGEEITLTNNTTILPIGIAEGVHTKILGRIVSTDYLVIECVGKGQITLGRSLLKLIGAKIDVEKGMVTTDSPYQMSHFKRTKNKGKKGKRRARANNGVDASSLENT